MKGLKKLFCLRSLTLGQIEPPVNATERATHHGAGHLQVRSFGFLFSVVCSLKKHDGVAKSSDRAICACGSNESQRSPQRSNAPPPPPAPTKTRPASRCPCTPAPGTTQEKAPLTPPTPTAKNRPQRQRNDAGASQECESDAYSETRFPAGSRTARFRGEMDCTNDEGERGLSEWAPATPRPARNFRRCLARILMVLS